MKRKVILTLRVLITLLFIAYVFYKAGLFSWQGRSNFFNLVSGASMSFVVLSLIMSFLLNLSSAVKWHMLLKSRKIKIGLGRTFAYYQIGKFYNLILPTSMGGDVVRIYELGKYSGKKAETVASVFVERFTGMIVLTVVSFCAVIINIKTYNIPLITGSLIFCIFIIALIGWLVIDSRPFESLKGIVDRKVPFLNHLFSKIAKVQMAVHDYKKDVAALWIAMVNSLIFYLLAVINVWVSAMAFDQDVNFISILVAVPAILLIMNLPISVGGIGLMEFAYTFTFEIMGYSSVLGLSTALLIRMKTFLDGGIGGLLHLFYFRDDQTNTFLTRVKRIKNQDLSER